MADTRWQAVAALVDPVRRALYDHVRRQTHPVTREEAADAVAISRTLTAFHLDKLVDVGLLHARYSSPADRRPGRGRPAKVYQASADGLTLSLPPRQYELVGQILADAVAEAPTDARAAADRHAFGYGREVGRACLARPPDGGSTSAPPPTATTVETDLAAAYTALADLGFEPCSSGELSLRNCPFHALAQRQPELVCGLNKAFIGGLLEGLAADSLDARLDPQPGSCCVRVTPSGVTRTRRT